MKRTKKEQKVLSPNHPSTDTVNILGAFLFLLGFLCFFVCLFNLETYVACISLFACFSQL